MEVMEPEIVYTDLDLDAKGGYERFIGSFRDKLARHRLRDQYIETHGDWLNDHPLLPQQQKHSKPERLIYINLKFKDSKSEETIETTIAIRDDNVYLIGFMNRNGQWYEFGFEEKSMRFIEGSSFLGCDLRYRDLVGDSTELAGLKLGRRAATNAVRWLSKYQQGVAADADTKKHLAKMCVMICESARMTPHYNKVRGGWETGVRISREQVEYTVNWSSMSRRLLSMSRWDLSKERNDLLDVLHLLLNTSGKKRKKATSDGRSRGPHPAANFFSSLKNWLWPLPTSSSSQGGDEQQHRTAIKRVSGRPLLEVYRVEARAGVLVETISVLDGKRGQIIYKHARDGSRSQAPDRHRELVLAGPYRAISADGSIVIQVDGTQGTDLPGNSATRVSGELSWNCYAADVVYDEVIKAGALSTATGLSLAEVTYTVWDDAVEAAVRVSLLLPAGAAALVYGDITAHCTSATDATVVLFRRTRHEQVKLVPSSDDPVVPLELGRSVFVVPPMQTHEHMRIQVNLHAHDGDQDVLLQGGIGFSFDKLSGEIHAYCDGDFFMPVCWDSHGSPGATTSAASLQQAKVQVKVTSPGFHMIANSPPV